MRYLFFFIGIALFLLGIIGLSNGSAKYGCEKTLKVMEYDTALTYKEVCDMILESDK